MLFKQILLLLSAVVMNRGDIPKDCFGYGCPVRYTPAPPGMTPSCARDGKTYCEEIENYPTHLILELINNWAYDIDSLITNEEPGSYHPRPIYGPPQYYSPPPVPQYQPPPNNFNMSQYSHIQRILPKPYNSFLRNNHDLYQGYFRPTYEAPPQDPHWWKTFGTFIRKKRQSDSPLSLCPTNAQFITPKAALNAEGNWMYIVNEVSDQNQKYTQLIRAETCRSRVCNGICSLPNGYSSKCEQQYVQKRLVALAPRGHALYTDKFWLPHCCICQIIPNIR